MGLLIVTGRCETADRVRGLTEGADAYKQQFNPAVIGVNVARLVYASVRDMIASITARAPYESATIPTLIIEPKDVSLHFESGEGRGHLSFRFCDDR